MNRPDKRNALDNEMFLALAATGEKLKSDKSVRVVVLSGEGSSFCAGLDFGSFQQMAGGTKAENAGEGNPGTMAAGRITPPWPAGVVGLARDCCTGDCRCPRTRSWRRNSDLPWC